MKTRDRLTESLHDSLEMLASPASEQAAYLGGLGVTPGADELALELDDAMFAVPGLVRDGLLTKEQANKISALHDYLSGMSGEQHADLWTEAALRQRPEWAEVREKASEVLRDFLGK